MKQETKVMKITPEMAKEFLHGNVDNRNIRGWWVTSLSNMIKRNEFITSHQGIAFSQSGRLLDGQHRLLAIVEADTPVNMNVTFNVDELAYKVVDSGIKRTYADLTGLNIKTAEICRLAGWLIYVGRLQMSAEQILDIYHHSGIGEVHDELINFCGTNRKGFSSAPVRLCAVMNMLEYPKQWQYIKEVYTNMIQRKYIDLPPIALQYIRQIDSRTVSTNHRGEVIVRALRVFNPEQANISRLIIREGAIEEAYAHIRLKLRQYIAFSKGEKYE
jgi:hypothetical protein